MIGRAAVLAAWAAICCGQIQGIVDLHVHSDPDSVPRSVDALEAARLAREAGMRALLLKNHFAPTVQLAYTVSRAVPGIGVYGGIVLNRAVGGINPAAVEAAANFHGGFLRVVWMPTYDAPTVPVSRDGKLLPEVMEVLRLIAQYKLALATGHVTAAEHVLLAREARRAGVTRVILTHPTGVMSLAQMQEAAGEGAFVELVYHALIAGGAAAPKVEDYVRIIREVGAAHCILSSDLGQADSPVHTAGWVSFLELLRKAGVSSDDIDRMARRNPAGLLGLD